MSFLWYLWIGAQMSVLALTTPQVWVALGLYVVAATVLTRRPKQPPLRFATWFLLLVPIVGLSVAAGALRGSLSGQQSGLHWQDLIAWGVLLLELGLTIWLAARTQGPRWLRISIGALILLFAFGVAFVHSMSIYDVWL